MAPQNVETEDDHPVLRVPPGAVPRLLKSDPFEKRREVPASPVATPEMHLPAPASTGGQHPAAARQWDFALPAPAPPKPADPLMDPGANWRRHTGLRAPEEAVSIPVIVRERFAENWERLASEPSRTRRGRARRCMERSCITRWLSTHGRFDFVAATGPLLLIALLVAAFIYGRRIFAGEEKRITPAVDTTTDKR